MRTVSLLGLLLVWISSLHGQDLPPPRPVWNVQLGGPGAVWRAAFEPSRRQFWIIDRDGRQATCVQVDQFLQQPRILRTYPPPAGYHFRDVQAQNSWVALLMAPDTAGTVGRVRIIDFGDDTLQTPRAFEVEVGFDPISCRFQGREHDSYWYGTRPRKPTGLLVANKGRAVGDFDPPGSLTWIPLGPAYDAASVRQYDFAYLDRANLDPNLHYSTDSAQPALDFEPEGLDIYTSYDDWGIALVSCPENNALVVVELDSPTLRPELVFAWGTQDFNTSATAFDPGSVGRMGDQRAYPVQGLLQPRTVSVDAILSEWGRNSRYQRIQFVTADGGAPRPGEAVRVADLRLDRVRFPNASAL